MVSGAPLWAQRGDDPGSPRGVNAEEYGRFAAAAAARYGGSFGQISPVYRSGKPGTSRTLRRSYVRNSFEDDRSLHRTIELL